MAIRKFVLLVPGHDIDGDPGAVGQGSTEAKENLQISDRVYNLLASHPNIVVERDDPKRDYVETVDWANAHYVNLEDGIVVEIHKNSASVAASGNEVLIPAGSDQVSFKLGNSIMGNLTKYTGRPQRGVKERGDLYLISAINMYACLVECGFINFDPIDDSMDAKMALAIANGICDFFGEPHVDAVAPTPAPTPVPTPPPAPAPTPQPIYTKVGHVEVHGDLYKKN